MPTTLPTLPPLPPDVRGSSGGPPTNAMSAFGGGDPTQRALELIETGYQMLGSFFPSLQPMCAQNIATTRAAIDDAKGAAAGPPPGAGGPTGPAITGMGQNPTALPAPPQGA